MEVLNPTAPDRTASFPRARRPGSISGKRLGLLSNGKPNADLVLDRLYQRLAAEVDLARPLLLDKLSGGDGTGRPAPEWMLSTLVAGTVAVLAASGD